MQRTMATCLALVALLTQALVSAAPHAVLCIKGGGGMCGTMAVTSECSCCCAAEPESAQPVIRLCTPCHDRCDDCIEVDLPDGVGDVNYALSLPACKAFQVETGVMLAALAEISSPPES